MQPASAKLLMITPSTLRGGVEEYTLITSRGAVNHGWNVHAAFPKTKGTTSLVRDITQSGVEYHPLAIAEESNWLPGSARHLPRFLTTLRLLLTLKPDVVHITLPAPDYCLGSILACSVLNVPTVVRFGLVLPLQTPINQWRVKAYAWARSRRQQWVVISQNNQRLLSQLFQIPESEIACVYNGAKQTQAYALSAEDRNRLRCEVRSELNLPDTAKILLTVGRLNFQKGHRDLIPAIPHIAKDFPDAHFVWVGDGDLREDLEALVRDYQVTDRVLFLGYRTDVPRLLQAADLFVFPTHFEGGQSFAIAEAMAHNLPIITSDASGIPEVIQDRVHGIVFRTGDSCGLLESIRWALRHPNEMQTMANNASKHSQEFTEEKMIQSYLEIWQKLKQLSKIMTSELPMATETNHA